MTDALKTSPDSPATAYARRLLAEHELKSPAFRAAMEGLPREIVVILLAMAFNDGTLQGAKQIAAGLKGVA